jgi:hypothetical protein
MLFRIPVTYFEGRKMRYLLALLASVALPGLAMGQVIATCGPSTGQAYYLHGGVVPRDEAGFQADAISGGAFTLSWASDTQVDVLYLDATGDIRSALAGGANIVITAATDALIQILVAYPGGPVKVYVFDLDDDEAVYTVSRADELLAKAAVYRVDCTFSGGSAR